MQAVRNWVLGSAKPRDASAIPVMRSNMVALLGDERGIRGGGLAAAGGRGHGGIGLFGDLVLGKLGAVIIGARGFQ